VSLFLNRSKRSDPHLEWKVRLFVVAAVLGVSGIYFEERWMGWVAILLLLSAMLLRFVGSSGEGEEEDLEGDGEDRAMDDDDIEDGAAEGDADLR
jgi:hypothetical protein